ncbi:TRAP transporter permease [Oceanidesulfovibrio marinus]|uniref:C4-dicarboxylate ABC transporter permease n=1 Tax=Oceanidesulfovibrio marinus TaxID=370038 RepID=A0A6P1ZHL4_9BACT|nr:TRAP transporter permease [Oceanidesulfovibrio marinus]QJT07424.1 TRAP transporter permease [Oceanidesulfovibrio marinus]TVM34661.1 C4-dicarboxylate ABC transporter permease [Oceanidesulfovibrio marinus]
MSNDTSQLSKLDAPQEGACPGNAEDIAERAESGVAKREYTGPWGRIILVIAVSMAVFHLYTAGFGLLAAIRQRAVHLAFVLPLVFLIYPARKTSIRSRPSIPDIILAVLSAVCAGYIVVNYQSIVFRGGMPNNTDIVFGLATLALVIEGARRALGIELATVAVVFLLYGYFGKYIPGIFAHRGADLGRLVDHLYLIPEGIFSVALGTSATYIVLFVIFGTFLERSGLGQLVQDMALALAGKAIGGPAKVSIFASALFGSISGSAAANVVSTGVFTIPLMKRIGYPAEFAGGVEAVASTAGQLMPPIMGASAFIMADFLGVPYLDIVKAAILPVVLYYTGLFVMVHMRARRLGLRGLRDDELPKLSTVMKERGHLLIPLIAILIMLVMQFTPLYAAFYGIIITLVVTQLRKHTRLSFQDIIWALETGAKRSVSIAAACAAVGIVIGISTLTSVGNTVGEFLLAMAQGQLLPALFMVMIFALILGMGLPTVAAYIILATVAAPILTSQFGLPKLVSHFFVFYFGLMANVTPPVAIPAYAAAGIACSSPSRTGWTAFKLALAGFLAPYLFVYSPQILLYQFTWAALPETLWVAFTAIFGVFLLACSIEGFLRHRLATWQRFLLGASSLLLIEPSMITDTIAFTMLVLVLSVQFITQKRLVHPTSGE